MRWHEDNWKWLLGIGIVLVIVIHLARCVGIS